MAMSMLHRRLPAFGKSLIKVANEVLVFHQPGRTLTSSLNYRQLVSVPNSKRLNFTYYNLHENSRHNSSTSASGTSSGTGLVDEVLKAKTADPVSEPSEEEERKKRENSARAVKYTLYAMGLMAIGGAVYVFLSWGAPAKDRSGKEIRDEFSDLPFFEQYYKRAMSEYKTSVTYITDPSREKLLPDPPPGALYPPYTVILELTGILVHPDWTYKTGWRFKKRPGVDYFLQALADQFEVVIYTQEQGFTAYPIVDALDKHGIASMRLFRDSTKYKDGVHTKDLDKINRDLRKTIIIDWNEKAIEGHRMNAIVLPKWDGSDDDRTLFDLAALLKTISTNDIDDVRIVLQHYAKFEDPMAEFRERQKQLAQQQIELDVMKKNKEKSGGGLQPNWSSISNVFKKH